MRNRDKWAPSKYVYRNGRLRASRDRKALKFSSRLAADLVSELYDEHIPTHVTGKLIDLGCGQVPLYEAYKNYVTDNLCVDWQNSNHKNIFLDHECDLAAALPFREGQFDTIVLSDVLEHIPVPEKLWIEMARILAPGGKVLMNTPFLYTLHEVPHDYYRYTEYALRRFALSVNLNVLVLESIGGAPEVVADILAKNRCFIPILGHGAALAIQFITRAFVRTSPGKRLSRRTGRRFPLGYFLVLEKPGDT